MIKPTILCCSGQYDIVLSSDRFNACYQYPTVNFSVTVSRPICLTDQSDYEDPHTQKEREREKKKRAYFNVYKQTKNDRKKLVKLNLFIVDEEKKGNENITKQSKNNKRKRASRTRFEK